MIAGLRFAARIGLAVTVVASCTHGHPNDLGTDAGSNVDTDAGVDSMDSPGGDGIHVTAPLAGATVSAPVAITATVATCSGEPVTALGYSIDNQATLNKSSSATTMNLTDSTMSVGAHTIHFKAWAGSTLCPVISNPITVVASAGYDGSPTIPEPPASATLKSNIDDLTGWSHSTGAASSCPNGVVSPTCNPPDANYNTTVEHVADPGTPPAGNDLAGLFQLYTSPKNATCIWGHSFLTDDAARNFIWDFEVYVDATSYAASELDFYQILNGYRLMMGTQCNRSKNSWDTWNEATQHWIPNTQIPCNTVLPANTWHHVIMYLSSDSAAKTYTYHTIRIDGVDYPLEQTEPGHASSWPEGLIGVQVQLDTSSTGDGVNEYIENMKTYAW